jgi:hypothetical protein
MHVSAEVQKQTGFLPFILRSDAENGRGNDALIEDPH